MPEIWLGFRYSQTLQILNLHKWKHISFLDCRFEASSLAVFPLAVLDFGRLHLCLSAEGYQVPLDANTPDPLSLLRATESICFCSLSPVHPVCLSTLMLSECFPVSWIPTLYLTAKTSVFLCFHWMSLTFAHWSFYPLTEIGRERCGRCR